MQTEIRTMKLLLPMMILAAISVSFGLEGGDFSQLRKFLRFETESTKTVTSDFHNARNQSRDLSEEKALGNVVQLNFVIKCTTGRSGLDYNNYGCYCGLGGAGKPVDGVDKCCQIHDECYGKVSKSGCKWLNTPHVVVYKYRCYSHHVACYDPEGCCDRLTCDCDRDFSECLAKVKYNPKYKRYPQKKC